MNKTPDDVNELKQLVASLKKEVLELKSKTNQFEFDSKANNKELERKISAIECDLRKLR